MVIMFVLFFECNSDHRDLHVLTHSYPYRRSSDLLDRLLAEAGESGPTALPNVDPDLAELIASLSEKERRLLRFLANGLSNKDLSDRLSVSTNTVKWHLRNIFEKLQIKNRVQAIALARRFGLID